MPDENNENNKRTLSVQIAEPENTIEFVQGYSGQLFKGIRHRLSFKVTSDYPIKECSVLTFKGAATVSSDTTTDDFGFYSVLLSDKEIDRILVSCINANDAAFEKEFPITYLDAIPMKGGISTAYGFGRGIYAPDVNPSLSLRFLSDYTPHHLLPIDGWIVIARYTDGIVSTYQVADPYNQQPIALNIANFANEQRSQAETVVSVDTEYGSHDIYIPAIVLQPYESVYFLVMRDGTAYYLRQDKGAGKSDVSAIQTVLDGNIARSPSCQSDTDCQKDHTVDVYTCSENRNTISRTKLDYSCQANQCISNEVPDSLYAVCKSNTYCIDGSAACIEKFFPFGVYMLGVSEEARSRLAEIPTTNTLFVYSDQETFEDNKIVSQWTGKASTSPHKLRYYTIDEPTATQIDENLVPLYQSIKRKDPTIPPTTALAHPAIYSYYIEKTAPAELITDYYPLTANMPTSGRLIQGALDHMIYQYFVPSFTAASAHKIPWWFVVQAHSWNDDPSIEATHKLREPSPAEIRAMTYLALAYGSTGIIYFMYGSLPEVNAVGLLDYNEQPTPKFYEVAQLGTEIQKLSPVLLSAKRGAVCNSKTLNQQLVAGNFLTDGSPWSFESNPLFTDVTTSAENGLRVRAAWNKPEGDFYDWWKEVAIDTDTVTHLDIEYEIKERNGEGYFYLNPGRLDGDLTDIPLDSTVGKHTATVAIVNRKGKDFCQFPDGVCESNILSRLAFYIYVQGESSLDVVITSIRQHTCSLQNVRSVTGNFEVAEFKQGKTDYIMLVNRDTVDSQIAHLALVENRVSSLVDAYSGAQFRVAKRTALVPLKPGHGRLLKITAKKKFCIFNWCF